MQQPYSTSFTIQHWNVDEEKMIHKNFEIFLIVHGTIAWWTTRAIWTTPYIRILSYENELLELSGTQELLEQSEQHLIQEFWADTQEETKATTLSHKDKLFLKFKTRSSSPETQLLNEALMISKLSARKNVQLCLCSSVSFKPGNEELFFSEISDEAKHVHSK
jgi:hypothetical protein